MLVKGDEGVEVGEKITNDFLLFIFRSGAKHQKNMDRRMSIVV